MGRENAGVTGIMENGKGRENAGVTGIMENVNYYIIIGYILPWALSNQFSIPGGPKYLLSGAL